MNAPGRAACCCSAALALAACGNENGRLQGWVEADLVFVGPDEAGRVEALHVREGDTVAAGAPLFAVDVRPAVRRSALGRRRRSAEARARLARLEAPHQRNEEVAVLQAQEKRAEAARRAFPRRAPAPATLTPQGRRRAGAVRHRAGEPQSRQAALEQVRRQITVARMASHDDDIAAAKQTLAAAIARRDAAETRLARRKLAAPAEGTVQQVYYRPGEMVPASRPVVSILPPHNIKLRFFVAQALLPKIALGDAVAVTCDGCRAGITAKVSFIARQAEYTPPVIYSLEERNKLVFMVEARPDAPDGLRVGQPVQVTLGAKVAEAKK